MSRYIQNFWTHTTRSANAEEAERIKIEGIQHTPEPYLPSSEEQAEEEAMLDDRELS